MVIFINSFVSIIIIVLAIIILIPVALIRASKKSVSKTNTLEEQVKKAISSARRIKFKAESDINRIKILASQTIDTVLSGKISTNFTTEQILENFATVKEMLKDKVDITTLEKTEKLILTYKTQIQLKEKEIEMAEKIESNYKSLLNKLKQAKQNHKINKRLERYKEKIGQMQENIDTQKQLLEQSYSYDMLEADVNQRLNYVIALEELQTKYQTENLITDTTQYQEELEQIIKHLDK